MPEMMTAAALSEALDTLRAERERRRELAVSMARDITANMADVRRAKETYLAVDERCRMLEDEMTRIKDEAAFRLRREGAGGQMSKAEAAGLFYRAALTGGDTRSLPKMAYEQLGLIPSDDPDQGHGSILVPETMGSELLMAPRTTNRLRTMMSVTTVPNLRLPRLGFEQDDSAFALKDGESAKELKLKGEMVSFGTHEYRVRASVAESVLRTTPVSLAEAIDEGLASAAAKKELAMIFGTGLDSDVKHMSLYQTGSDGQTVIKSVSGSDLYTAWTSAYSDLEDDYREQAAGVMRFSDYVKMLRDIAPNADFFNAAPERILGVPVVFTEYATTPVVGAFKYLHLNFVCAPWADVENVPSVGLRRFYLNSLYDIQVKMASAFRLVKVTG